MTFEIVGTISDIRTIASGTGVRLRKRLSETYGHSRWRKLAGIATVWLANGADRRVELHWYEAHGVGKREMKIKRYLTD